MMIGKKIAILVASASLGACLFASVFCLVRFWYEGAERQRSAIEAQSAFDHLRSGMTRPETRPFVQDAWMRYVCDNETIEVYLFGSRDPDLAHILFLRFDIPGEDGRVTQIATVENYRLFLYEQCSKVSR